MSFYDEMLAAMTNRLRAQPTSLFYSLEIADDERVVAYKEDQGDDGFCETCSYIYDFVLYTVENEAGEQREIEERNTDLGTLLRDLERYSD